LSAFLGASLAFVGAALAVFGLVFAAFRSTSIANVGADPANLLSEVRSAAHVTCRRPANFSTVFVEPNALGHFGYLSFP
jgi:hypothetical protein